jgi:Protein of unknown function (DUF3667)
MICPNCAAEHTGEFCNACGQSNLDLHVPISGLFREAAEEALGIDSRLRHTLIPFFIRPGEVTRDYLQGRRARFTSPLKMYIVAAAIFFFSFARHPQPNVVHLQTSTKTAAPREEGRLERYIEGREAKLRSMGEEGPKALGAGMVETLPKAMIVLLPVFALLLKLFWRRRYYAEHLIFALHYHAFALIALTPGGFLAGKAGDSATGIALILCLVYLFLALRRVYADGRLRTFAKLCGLSVFYTFILLIAISGSGMISLATL